jgi:hypothetical protein
MDIATRYLTLIKELEFSPGGLSGARTLRPPPLSNPAHRTRCRPSGHTHSC